MAEIQTSTADPLLGLVGKVVDTVREVGVARAANASRPPPAPTDEPRIPDTSPKNLATGPAAPVTPMRSFPQWQLWLGGTVAIAAVISLALLATRRRAA